MKDAMQAEADAQQQRDEERAEVCCERED